MWYSFILGNILHLQYFEKTPILHFSKKNIYKIWNINKFIFIYLYYNQDLSNQDCRYIHPQYIYHALSNLQLDNHVQEYRILCLSILLHNDIIHHHIFHDYCIKLDKHLSEKWVTSIIHKWITWKENLLVAQDNYQKIN